MNRLRRAWSVLWGEDLGSSYPNRIVQMLNYHEYVLALDKLGDVYKIEMMYDGLSKITLLLSNPVRPW